MSVIIPTCNRQEFLGKAIDSVLGQSCWQDFELILGDDGSTDDTARLVAGYGCRVRLSEENFWENG
ncbi:MAG: glycosyltransferase family 2 protein [Desulfurivibrio sp.]|nr:MAG: glycosyltransferase family 2 protein [Desulfurivibrio sp.]